MADRKGGFKGGDAEWTVLMSEYLHEQTGLTAGTIADDDELATDLGHLDTGQRKVSNDKRFRGSNETLNGLKQLDMLADGGLRGEGDKWSPGRTGYMKRVGDRDKFRLPGVREGSEEVSGRKGWVLKAYCDFKGAQRRELTR